MDSQEEGKLPKDGTEEVSANAAPVTPGKPGRKLIGLSSKPERSCSGSNQLGAEFWDPLPIGGSVRRFAAIIHRVKEASFNSALENTKNRAVA